MAGSAGGRDYVSVIPGDEEFSPRRLETDADAPRSARQVRRRPAHDVPGPDTLPAGVYLARTGAAAARDAGAGGCLLGSRDIPQLLRSYVAGCLFSKPALEPLDHAPRPSYSGARHRHPGSRLWADGILAGALLFQ